MRAIDEKALEAAAIALIDHDPSISGHHPIHIDYKRPIARAAITAYLSAMPQRELLAEALDALQGLHDDVVEYVTLNKLHDADGSPAINNHWMRRARAAADKIRAALEHDKGEPKP